MGKMSNEYLEYLRGLLKPGDLVYTKVVRVAESGMSKTMDVYIARNNRIIDITGAVAVTTGHTLTKDEHVRVSGCGMNAGFGLVYDLSSVLWPNGFECIGDNCPSNDHLNGDRNYAPHIHSCGGYALKQSWM